ncbi:DUF2884 family protein [Glaciecola sp. 1036]|uniref:DUF2884 family protein n=1 Tax=Alteromonadaceae TaxID=72275 RepID=UPI003D028AA4
MKAMLTTILAVLALILSPFTKAEAHEYGVSEQCDVNINAELNVAEDLMTITLDNGDILKINAQGDTWKNGSQLSLNSAQRSLTQQYYSDIKALVPDAIELASDAIAVTNTALTKVLNGLFGENNSMVQSLSETLSEIETELRDAIYQPDGSMQFGKAIFAEEGSFSKSLNTKIDSAVEELMAEAMGQMFVVIGKAMMSGDTDLADFETRMENLGEELEQEIEVESAKIESSAKRLCDSLEVIDNTENALQKYSDFSKLDLVKLNQRT